MTIFVHVVIFLASASIVWFFAGILIESVNRVARGLHKTGFSVAFFVLGFLTSISEVSVAVNATIDKVPQVSAGNLIGASFVILLFIVPFLAVAGRGIELNHTISNKNLAVAFAVIILPALLVVDGNVTRNEGLLMLLGYLVLVWAIERQHNSTEKMADLALVINNKKKIEFVDIGKILLGGVAIFIAAHFLVEQAVYFAEILSVPSSLMGLVLLSVGTNVPELTIAARSILKKHKDIAFGDYLGSAAANTPIFAILAMTNGGFSVEPSEFVSTIILMFLGLGCLYLFAGSNSRISRGEGWILLVFYVAFLMAQTFNFIRFSSD